MLSVEEGCAFTFVFPRPYLIFCAKKEDGGGRHSSGTSGPSEALAGD